MKKKLITACVMPFLAACGQNSSDIFTINDGRIDGLHAPWDGLDDDTKFRCSTDDSLFKFSFEVNDSTLTLEPEYKDKMSVIYEDRVEIFFSPDTLMSHYYGAEMDPAGRVLDYQAEYYRQFDYTWGFKTLKYTGDIKEGHYPVSGSIDLNELRELGLRLEEGFYMGVFRADYRKDGSVNWYSAVITDDETADFHKPDMLFKAILKK